MMTSMLGAALSAVLVLTGCVAPKLPSAAGEVSGPLLSIELYVGRPEHRKPYRTVWREHLSASDRDVYVGLYWNLPAPGNYVTTIALRTPAGSMHNEQESRFRADATAWFMWHPLALPQGDEAQQSAGPWQADVSLDGTPVGRRTFILDPGSLRLRTEARVVILLGSDDPEAAAGDWMWLNRAAALEAVKAAHATLGIVLRDELARRFPHVDGPKQPPADPDASVLLRTNFTVSPNPDTDARLALDVVHVPTQSTRTFRYRSSEGIEQMGATRQRDDQIAAAHLAFQAAVDPELLEYLATLAKARPE